MALSDAAIILIWVLLLLLQFPAVLLCDLGVARETGTGGCQRISCGAERGRICRHVSAVIHGERRVWV